MGTAPLAPPACPRCGGRLAQLEEPPCLPCGWVDYSLPGYTCGICRESLPPDCRLYCFERVFGLHRDTVRKMLKYSVPPGYRRARLSSPDLPPLCSCIQLPHLRLHRSLESLHQLRQIHVLSGGSGSSGGKSLNSFRVGEGRPGRGRLRVKWKSVKRQESYVPVECEVARSFRPLRQAGLTILVRQASNGARTQYGDEGRKGRDASSRGLGARSMSNRARDRSVGFWTLLESGFPPQPRDQPSSACPLGTANRLYAVFRCP